MKTAISVDDALREYLKKRRWAGITEQLNRAYGDGQTAEERLLVRQMRSKLRALDPW